MLQIVKNAIEASRKRSFLNTRPSLYSDNPEKISSWDAYQWYQRFPHFNRVYVDTVIEKYKVLRHTSPRVFPFEVLRSKAPNQNESEWAYQCALYKPTTIAIWNKAVNKTKLISNKQNYSIEWDAEAEDQKQYFYKDFPIYHSLVSWVFEVLAVEKLNFPNRACVIMPNVPKDAEGNPIQTELAEPIPYIIDEENIVHYEYGNSIVWVTDWTAGKMQFEAIDRQNYYRFVQDGDSVQEFITYVHGWDFLPAFKLRGKAENVDGEILYSSYFSDAIPVLDEAIQVRSNLMMSHFKLAYPIIIEVVDDCDECKGLGKIWSSEQNDYITCTACDGKGTKSGLSPTSTYQVRATRSVGDKNELPLTPPVQFAAPNSDILRYGKEFLDSLESKAFDFLFKPKNADSATATEVAKNESEWHSFLVEFSNSVFDDLEYLLEGIGFIRYGEAFRMPKVRRPTEFSFKTNAEISEELNEAKTSKLPAVMMRQLYKDYGNTRFNTTNMSREFQFQTIADKYWYLDFTELRLIAAEADPVDIALHIAYTTIIANLEAENTEFWEQEIDAKIAQVREKAQEAALPIINNRQGANVADIFSNILNQ